MIFEVWFVSVFKLLISSVAHFLILLKVKIFQRKMLVKSSEISWFSLKRSSWLKLQNLKKLLFKVCKNFYLKALMNFYYKSSNVLIYKLICLKQMKRYRILKKHKWMQQDARKIIKMKLQIWSKLWTRFYKKSLMRKSISNSNAPCSVKKPNASPASSNQSTAKKNSSTLSY